MQVEYLRGRRWVGIPFDVKPQISDLFRAETQTVTAEASGYQYPVGKQVYVCYDAYDGKKQVALERAA